MKFIENAKHSVKLWAHGSPPMDDVAFEHIRKEFWVLLYVSGVFLDLRENTWIISLLGMILYISTSCCYLLLFSILAYILRDDFVEASHNIHMSALFVMVLTMIFFINSNRGNLRAFLIAWSRGFYDYGDDFQIPEMKEEIRKEQRTKLAILVAVPSYMALTGVVSMSGRTMDEYFGDATNESYVGGVYMKTPMPMWYPFVVDTYLKFLLASLSQALAAGVVCVTISGADAALIFCHQALAIQLKTIIYRLKRIEHCAYELHKKSGKGKLAMFNKFEDSNFLKCYNVYLGKIANHHSIVIENFIRVQTIIRWTAGAAVTIGTFVIAMSLFAFVLGGGKPSMTSFVSLLMGAEILNMAMMCGMSEQVAEQAEAIRVEVYGLNWTEVDMQAKRTMMIIIEGTKKPLVLRAGLTLLNWTTFSTIMNTSYSYFNLLIATRAV